ncbi:MAG: hypothetical protein AAFW75_26145, partial [Cyanobacteria bacterium J06636_16]
PYLPMKRWEYSRYKAKTGIDPELEGIWWGVINDATNIVIEGFPRSGNTFSSVAFRYAQQAPVRIAYRLHAPIQLIEAARHNIPAVVLCREPEGAILSWVIHRSYVTIPQALRGYLRFYQRTLPYLDRLVVADFHTVINDYGRVIREVNEKFGTQFTEFQHTQANVDACFALIDEFYKSADGSERIVARPSEHRKQLKEQLRAEFLADELAGLREQAYDLYGAFVKSKAPEAVPSS